MKTPNERLNLVFRNCQNGTRIIAVRLMAFILTASIGQGLYLIVKRPRFRNSRAAPRLTLQPSASVAVESTPQISFPNSLGKIPNVDVWIPLSMVVDSDGMPRNIHVELERAVTNQGLSFYDEVLSKTTGKQAVEITRELIETLTNEMRGTTFKPRIFNGRPLPTMVFVDSHFRSNGKSCWAVECEFKTSEGRFWSVLMRSDDRCFEFSN